MPQKIAAQLGEARMVVTLESYLARLREAEAARPEGKRRRVPGVVDLARELGVRESTVRRLVKNETEYINRHLFGAIIKALRAQGFDAEITDLLSYVEGEGE